MSSLVLLFGGILAVARSRRTQTLNVLPSKAPGEPARIREATAADDLIYQNFVCYELFFQGKLELNRFTLALSKTLDDFPALAGRFVRKNGRWEVLENGAGPLVTVKYASTHLKLDQVADLNKVTRSRRMGLELPCKVALRDGQTPTLFVQVASFNQGEFTVITLNPSHFIMDGASLVRFTHTLSFHCGGSLPPTKPLLLFERGTWNERMSDRQAQVQNEPHPLLDASQQSCDLPTLLTRAFTTHHTNQFLIPKAWLTDVRNKLNLMAMDGQFSINTMVMGLLGLCLSSATQPKLLTLFVVTNLRERCELYPRSEFVGNASEWLKLVVQIPSHVPPGLEPLYQVCKRISKELSLALESTQGEDMCLWNEALKTRSPQHIQDDNPQSNLQAVFDSEHGVIFNSWRGYDWYGVDFGLGHRPRRVGIDAFTEFFLPRYVHLEDCNQQGDVRLVVQLSLKELELIHHNIRRLDLPLQRVCTE